MIYPINKLAVTFQVQYDFVIDNLHYKTAISN